MKVGAIHGPSVHTAGTQGHGGCVFRGEAAGDTGLARSCSTPELFPLAPGSVTQAQSSRPLHDLHDLTSAGAIWSFRRPSEQHRGQHGCTMCARSEHTGYALADRDHWMISSARIRSACGIVRPRALAVLRLITSSNFVGCSTGRSPGLAPLRILST